jgi:type 2A phosphatase activator TIP41
MICFNGRLSPFPPQKKKAEWVVADEQVVDRQMLQSRDPILFYDDITLYEDELHDHGAVQLNVKARVMPK